MLLLCAVLPLIGYTTVLNHKLYLETCLCIYWCTIHLCLVRNTVNLYSKKAVTFIDRLLEVFRFHPRNLTRTIRSSLFRKAFTKNRFISTKNTSLSKVLKIQIFQVHLNIVTTHSKWNQRHFTIHLRKTIMKVTLNTIQVGKNRQKILKSFSKLISAKPLAEPHPTKKLSLLKQYNSFNFQLQNR